jgi:phage-related protein
MPVTFVFPVQEENQSPVTRKNSLDFGNGYAHNSPDGINTLIDIRDLVLRPLRFSDATTIKNALNALNGDWFYWTPQGESQGKFTLEKVQQRRNAKDGDTVYLTLTVKRVYIP